VTIRQFYFAKPSSETIPPIILYALIAIAANTITDRSFFFVVLISPAIKAAAAMPVRMAVKE